MEGTPYISYPGKIATVLYHIIKAEPAAILVVWKLFGVIFGFTLCLMAFSNLRRKNSGGVNRYLQSSALFITIAIVGIIILRLPNLVLKDQTSDENFWIINAAKFMSGAILWKNVSGATGGPLVYVPVSIMYYLFGGLNYATLRLFGLFFCIIPTLIFTYLAFARLFNKATVAFLLLPLVMFFAYQRSTEMIGYNSEHVAMVLIAFGLWLFSGLNKASKWRVLLLGIVLGLTPYAKLQSMPVTFAIIVCVLSELLFFGGKPVKQKILSLVSFVTGGIIPTLLMLGYLLSNNAVPDFWNGYIIDNLQYTKGFTVHYIKPVTAPVTNVPSVNNIPAPVTSTPAVLTHGKLSAVADMIKENGSELFILFLSLFILMALALITIKLCRIKVSSDSTRRIVYFSAISVFSIISVAAPHTHFVHYFFLAVIPFLFLAGQLGGYSFQLFNEIALVRRTLTLYVLMVVAATLTLMCVRGNKGIDFVRDGNDYKVDSIAKTITLYAHPNEKVALWGEQIGYFVQTGTIPATKGLPIFNAMFNPGKLDFYMQDYMNDIKDSRPIVFLDNVTTNSFLYYDTAQYKHEKYSTLNDIVRKNYSLVNTIDENRIYVLNSRLEEMGLRKNK